MRRAFTPEQWVALAGCLFVALGAFINAVELGYYLKGSMLTHMRVSLLEHSPLVALGVIASAVVALVLALGRRCHGLWVTGALVAVAVPLVWVIPTAKDVTNMYGESATDVWATGVDTGLGFLALGACLFLGAFVMAILDRRAKTMQTGGPNDAIPLRD